jgi:hypothetical protein
MPVMFQSSGVILFAASGVIAMDPACCCTCIGCNCANVRMQYSFDGDLAALSRTFVIAQSQRLGANDCEWLMASPWPCLPAVYVYSIGLTINDAGACGLEFAAGFPGIINTGTVDVPIWWTGAWNGDSSGMMFTTNSGGGCPFGRAGFDPCTFPITFTVQYRRHDTTVDPPVDHFSTLTVSLLGCA